MNNTKNRLLELRTARGLSQTELAAQATVGLATVNRVERWHFRVTEATARRLADALGCEVQEVFPYLEEGEVG